MIVKNNTEATLSHLQHFDEIILASGVIPHIPEIDGHDNPIVKPILMSLNTISQPAKKWR